MSRLCKVLSAVTIVFLTHTGLFAQPPKAASDTTFNNGSGISTIPSDRQTIGRLTNLGMLWGFLKYHHPAVAGGDYNWDAALFRVLPKLLAAPGKEQANTVLEQWVDSLGIPSPCRKCPAIVKDSDTKLLPDYGYLFNNDNFSPGFIAKLTYIKNNRSQGKQFYVGMIPGVGNPDFRNESPYKLMLYPDAGYRLLALYRYWNIIQYFFPDKHLIGEDWNKVLPEFIPEFVNASDTLSYQLACLHLIARVHDTHAAIYSSVPPYNNYLGKYYPPVQTKFIEGKLVVTAFYTDTAGIKNKLHVGDVIIKVDNITVDDLVQKFLPATPASNYETQLRNMPMKILRGQADKAMLEIERDGKTLPVLLERYPAATLKIWADYKEHHADTSSYKLINGDIGYVYPGWYHNSQLPAIKELFKNTKGIIVDMRCYPADFMPFTFGAYIKPSASGFVKFTNGSLSSPGLFTFSKTVSNGSHNKDYYKGKIIVIVNEITQSSAEYTTMALQSAPNATVIGSTTAGADGNVSAIYLPGNIFTYMSGIGVLYPDGTETQRVGIRIDIPIRPTVKGIREGRDEPLDKAIELIEKVK